MIAAEGEHKASRALRHAAEVIAGSPAALQVNDDHDDDNDDDHDDDNDDDDSDDDNNADNDDDNDSVTMPSPSW